MENSGENIPSHCAAANGLIRRVQMLEKALTRREHKARENDAQLAVIADRLNKIDRHLTALIRALNGVGAVTDLMSGRGLKG